MPINKTISDKRKRQCAKLVELSKAVVREAFEKFKPEEIGVTWTGGKDSGLTLMVHSPGLSRTRAFHSQNPDHRRRG